MEKINLETNEINNSNTKILNDFHDFTGNLDEVKEQIAKYKTKS